MITIYGKNYDIETTIDLDLSEMELTEIPENISKLINLQKLCLSTNKIKKINENIFFLLTKLYDLDLEDNEITNLEENTFKSLINLQKLNIGCNNITKIEKNTFDSLINLQELYIENNEITKIEDKMFDSLINLRILNVGFNKLIKIEEYTFKSLTKLQKLDIFDNQITHIEENTFDSLINLQNLNLGWNEITHIEENTFDSLINLQELKLSHNQITKIEENTFKSLFNLQELNIDSNQITKIEKNTFKLLTNLQKLDFSDNQISTLETNTFISLTNLQRLNFGYNQITNIDEKLFCLMTNLEELHLNNNQITRLPLSLLYCRHLTSYHIDDTVIIDIRIQRCIDHNRNIMLRNYFGHTDHGIFNDSQNIHVSSIQYSTRESINNLMKDDTNYSKDFIIDELIKLNPKCLKSLLCYMEDTEIHSILLLTFNEVFIKVFNRIITSEHKDDLIKRLDEEMQESECKCFTGRITRLVNVLCGYFDDINITISNNERISAIILTILNGEEMNDELKKQCIKQLKENDFTDEEINKWLN